MTAGEMRDQDLPNPLFVLFGGFWFHYVDNFPGKLVLLLFSCFLGTNMGLVSAVEEFLVSQLVHL